MQLYTLVVSLDDGTIAPVGADEAVAVLCCAQCAALPLSLPFAMQE